MQAAAPRTYLLIAVLLVGVGLQALASRGDGAQAPRWPADDQVYAAEAWSVGALSITHSSNNTDLVTRTYQAADDQRATLTIVAQPEPKLYGAGAEVPFLGDGLEIEPAPADLVSADRPGINALVARRDDQRWLVMYAYGERRGLLGNGLLPWTFAVADSLSGQPTSYYKLYLLGRVDTLDPVATHQIAALASALFPNIATWYAS